MGKKIILIGWDAAAPRLVFDRFRDSLPNVGKIMKAGLWGNLRTVFPPITIPAWRCMVTGRTPGELGLWGFRHRKGYSYDDFSITTSVDLEHNAIWDAAGARGKSSICSAVPPSYPPYRINGSMISCFMTPDTSGTFTYPADLGEEINRAAGGYSVDADFRIEDKDSIRKNVFEITGQHFKAFEYLVGNKKWDFAMHVEIGLDRIQHAFWRYFDEGHHLYEKNSRYGDTVLEYYKLLDGWLGRFMDRADEETLVIVASDHGAKAMKGAFCVNQWLEETGYLKFRRRPARGQKVQEADIDWKKTKAWGWGGYYSRIFFNVQGREEQGCIKPSRLAGEMEKLKKKIKALKGPDGEEWKTLVFRPEELYENPAGEKPDLMVFWDDLNWRSAGTVGNDSAYLRENDTGPDDGVHDWEGIVMCWKKGWDGGAELKGTDILDIYPTVLKYMDVDAGYRGRGRIIKEFLR
ncbi:MAG: alkaline phosphatase family protein [Elusimicrobia bacterium]|nr:alkaline phosphatase family protein [Elusimicrobiota bacterium]